MKLLSRKLKQKLAEPSRYYGDGGTIHHGTSLDVEVYNGKVVAVWFRCQRLPFSQCPVDEERAREMAYPVEALLTGVEVLDLDDADDLLSNDQTRSRRQR